MIEIRDVEITNINDSQKTINYMSNSSVVPLIYV